MAYKQINYFAPVASHKIEIPIFELMHSRDVSAIRQENSILASKHLQRQVIFDIYFPSNFLISPQLQVLLINDGQNLEEMQFREILAAANTEINSVPLICVGIHADKNRRHEYGIAGSPDYLGRGERADKYSKFLVEELLPEIFRETGNRQVTQIMIAGFSLGGLMALDLAWKHPDIFSVAGVFSGSLWWRSMSQDAEDYSDDLHRIMHQQVRNGSYKPGLKFFFQCGNMDETMDRNNNGIIDSIDDTRDLIKELEAKGYKEGKDIYYLEMPDGRHDIPTWGRAMPEFLSWAIK
jgi:enterochelin esterase-like enzyme